MSPVTVVPILAPKIIQVAWFNEIRWLLRRPMRIIVVAEELWIIAVMAVPGITPKNLFEDHSLKIVYIKYFQAYRLLRYQG